MDEDSRTLHGLDFGFLSSFFHEKPFFPKFELLNSGCGLSASLYGIHNPHQFFPFILHRKDCTQPFPHLHREILMRNLPHKAIGIIKSNMLDMLN